MNVPTEHAEQVTFLNWFRSQFPGVLIFSIPNGSFRHKATAAKLKMEGVVKGIPDLFIPEWNLWIEMKRTKGSTTSAEQKEMIEHLNKIGHTAIICKGHQAAIEAVNDYCISKR
jgi:hypothetical protein